VGWGGENGRPRHAEGENTKQRKRTETVRTANCNITIRIMKSYPNQKKKGLIKKKRGPRKRGCRSGTFRERGDRGNWGGGEQNGMKNKVQNRTRRKREA